jgi:hypothetical protein
MELTAQEIESIEEAGMLNGAPVKLIRTKGGFWIATGRPKGKLQEEALSAGSHPAIVKYNLERQHPEFQPSMMKSEFMSDSTIVEKHSHFLSDVLRKSGHDVYSVQNGDQVEFQITKQNAKIASVIGSFKDGSLTFKDLNIDRQFTRALAGATSEKAVSCGAQKIKIQGK